jgi:hypothetical protein
LAEQLGRANAWQISTVTSPVPSAERTRACAPRTGWAAEGHQAGLSAMANRRPVGVVAAFGSDQPGDVLLKHGLEHLQAGPHGQAQQPLVGSTG